MPLIWNGSTEEMLKSTKKVMLDEPMQKARFKDFVPKVDEKRNKKNDSCLNFAHRIDLKRLSELEASKSPMRPSKRGGETTDQFFLPKDLTQGKRESLVPKEPDDEVVMGNNRDASLKEQPMRASYENLIQQAKTKLIRTFLDREKRRQN